MSSAGRIGRAYPRVDCGLATTGSTMASACPCPESTAPTRPAVVLDRLGGTGTTAMVAWVLGRVGISVDASADYCRLAQWRTGDPKQLERAARIPKPRPPR